MNKKLLIIFITVFVDLVGFGIIIPMNPYLAKLYGAGPLHVGLLMSVYSLMQFLFSPFWGQLSDRKGRRPVILISLFGAAVSHFGFATASSLTGLMIFRALAGICGGNLPAAMAYIADVTPAKDRSKGMGLIGAAFGLGFILGPAIGGVFAQVGFHLGDKPPFAGSFPAVIASLICLANFISAYFFLPESLTPEMRQQHPATERGHRFKRIFDSLGRPTLGPLMILYFISTFTLAQVEAALFLFVQDRFEWTFMQASFGFAYIGVMMAFTQGGLIRRLQPKWGESRMMVIGLAVMSLGLFGLAVSHHLPILALSVTLLAIGYGMASPSISGSISLWSKANEQGNNLGVAQSLASLARIAGPACGGILYQSVGMAVPFVVSGATALAGLSLALGLKRKLKEAHA